MCANISGLSGGVYYQSLPDGATYPNLVFSDITEGRSSLTGGQWKHEQSAQFTFTGLDEDSVGEAIENGMDYLQDNTTALVVSGWPTTLKLQNIFGAPGVRRFGDVYRGSIDFQIELLKDK